MSTWTSAAFEHLKCQGKLIEWTGTSGQSLFRKQNFFLLSTLHEMGGSERVKMHQHLEYFRVGGSKEDIEIAALLFDRSYPTGTITLDPQEIAVAIGVDHRVTPHSVAQVIKQADINLDANPGPSYVQMGFRKKGECVSLIYENSLFVEASLKEDKPVPGILYGLAGRPALLGYSSILRKVKQNKPLGRAIWIADAHEPLLTKKYTIPLQKEMLRVRSPVRIGYNKFDRELMFEYYQQMVGHDAYVSLDFSKFDSTLPPFLLFKVYEVFVYWFGSEEVSTLRWIWNSLVYSQFVMGNGTIYRKCGGMPSGSGLTAMVDSIANQIILLDFMKSNSWVSTVVERTSAEFLGDDNRIGITFKDGIPCDAHVGMAQRFLRLYSRFVDEKYGMCINPDKSAVGSNIVVSVYAPRVPQRISDGSRRTLAKYRKELERKLKRKLTFEERFERLAKEPDGAGEGNTHRWSYHFHGAVSFLCYYYKPDGRGLVRPASESITRLVNPERQVRSIDDHIGLIMSTLIDNVDNAHIRNRMYLYFSDAMRMKRMGITTNELARADILIKRKIEGRSFFKDRVEADKPQTIHSDERCWFRKQKDVVLLEDDPREHTFRVMWKEVLRRAFKLRSRLESYDREYYIIRDQMRKQARGSTFGMQSYGRAVSVMKGFSSLCDTALSRPYIVAAFADHTSPKLGDYFNSFWGGVPPPKNYIDIGCWKKVRGTFTCVPGSSFSKVIRGLPILSYRIKIEGRAVNIVSAKHSVMNRAALVKIETQKPTLSLGEKKLTNVDLSTLESEYGARLISALTTRKVHPSFLEGLAQHVLSTGIIGRTMIKIGFPGAFPTRMD